MASFASAATFAGPGTGSGPGELDTPGRIAVEPSTGNLFVVDSGNDRIQVFKPNASNSAEFLTQFGGSELSAPWGIAIDEEGGTTYVYVADASNDRIVKYASDGGPTPAFAVDPSFVSPAKGPAAGQIGNFHAALAADPTTHDLLVADNANKLIERFDADGVAKGSFDGSAGAGSPGAFTGPIDVAVNSAGDIYAIDANGPNIAEQEGTSKALRYSASGEYKATLGPVGARERVATVAVDPDTDEVLVSGEQDAVYEEGPPPFLPALGRFDPANNLLSSPKSASSAQYDTVSGLAFAGSGRYYVAFDVGHFHGDPFGNPQIQSGPLTPPTVAMDLVNPATVTDEGAEFSGTVNPNGLATTYRFQYFLNGSTAGQVPSPVASAGSGTTPVAVSATAAGLKPSTEYEALLKAANADGEEITTFLAFKTAPRQPAVQTRPSPARGETTALLVGTVNPFNAPTTYWFEYGTTIAYGNSVPVSEDAAAGAGETPKAVGLQATGLQPSTTYHYRLVASNAAGTVYGADQTVTTRAAASPGEGCPNAAIRVRQGAQGLPECRAYEKVSPAAKLGYDVRRATGTIRSASDGEAVTYNVFGPFAGEAEGTSGAIPRYLSRRNGSEWVTKSVNAPQMSERFWAGFIGFFFLQNSADFSSDLRRSVLMSWEKPLAPDLPERVANRWNLALRDNDRDSYQLVNKVLSGPPPPGPAGTAGVLQIATSEAVTEDLGHIVFQTAQNLTPEASGSFYKTYEWDHGEVRLVGLLPGEVPAPAGSSPGSGATSTSGLGPYVAGDRDQSHAISRDGSRIFFTALPTSSNGRLYMREYGAQPDARTVWVSRSEASSPGTPLPAQFRDATPDGARVFFTSKEKLLDEDTNTATDLYRYDIEASGGHHLTLISRDSEPADGVSADVQGMIGTSDSGDRAYFVAKGQLEAGGPMPSGPLVAPKLYLWDDGIVRYLHTFGVDKSGDTEQNPNAANYKESRNWSQVQSEIKPSMVSGDGRYLLFQTYTDITGIPNESEDCRFSGQGGPGPCAQLYVFDAQAGAGEEFSAGRLGRIEQGRELDVVYDPANPEKVELS